MQLLQWMLHLDVYLVSLVDVLGVWSYVALFAVIFFERGCILTPFLPGDSLLFATGVIAATGGLNIQLLMLTLCSACFIGTLLNFWLGSRLGPYVYARANTRWLNKRHLDKAHAFFEQYGGMALIFSCFIPIIRTFTPFVAGMALMNKKTCLVAATIASLVWVAGLLLLSYLFGNIPFIKAHFSWIVIALIIVPSLLPVIAHVRSCFNSR